MKTLKIIAFIIAVLFILFYADYKLGRTVPMEIGIVAHKTFAPPGNYHRVKSEPDMYVLVVLQTDKQRGYFINVPKDYFYDIEDGDRVPLRKHYGWLSGYEYEQELIIGD